jgi:hypothetical protein
MTHHPTPAPSRVVPGASPGLAHVAYICICTQHAVRPRQLLQQGNKMKMVDPWWGAWGQKKEKEKENSVFTSLRLRIRFILRPFFWLPVACRRRCP